MTQTNAFSYHRRTPSGSNASKLRTRPALHRKGTSSVNHPISKLGSGQVKRFEPEDDLPSEMAASFLNFCAMCERQITVPDNTLLYCSESCRRKDSYKPLSASFPSLSSSSPMSPSASPPTSPTISSRVIVPPMTPTKAPISHTRAIRIPIDINDAKTDQDPSEWKPVIPNDSRAAGIISSDAWKYLSQFHSDETILPVRRPKAGNRSSTSLSTLMSATAPLPSLSHTPSSMASSVSSEASDYMSYMHGSTHRPLPPRHNSYFANSASAAKGLELVVPHVHVAADVSSLDMSHKEPDFPSSGAIWDGMHVGKKHAAFTSLGMVDPGTATAEK